MKKLPLFLLFCFFSFSLAQAQDAWGDLDKIEIYEKNPVDDIFHPIPYTIIKNTAEFNLYANAAREALKNDFPLTANIFLVNDIDLGFFFDGKNCVSKADSKIASFAPIPLNIGTFDGNNHTITGLCVQENAEGSVAGLFGEKSGLIKNLKIEGAHIEGDIAGGVIGASKIDEETTINTALVNVHVINSTVTGKSRVGGLVGSYFHETASIYLEINQSDFEGSVLTAKDANDNSCVGGLVGFANAITVEGSFVKGSLDAGAGNCLGGLIGQVEGHSTPRIKYSYLIASLKAAGDESVGMFIGTAPNESSIISSYAALSPSKTLPIVGGASPIFSFPGFYASAEGGEDFSNFGAVQDSLLRQPLAAYTLNTFDDSHTPWTQFPDSNNGYPFIKPNHFYPLYKITLIDPITDVPTKTVFNSPITGNLDPTVFDDYPTLGGIGESIYSFEEMDADSYNGLPLNPKSLVDSDAEYFLSLTKRQAIHYDLKSTDGEQIFWIDDSLSNYSEKYTNINLPKIIKANSCFAGWQATIDGNEAENDPVFTLEFSEVFPDENHSVITLIPVWAAVGEECDGIKSEFTNEVRVNSSNGIVLLKNNGNLIYPKEYGYAIPSASFIGSGVTAPTPLAIPLTIQASPKEGFILESLYSLSNELQRPLSSEAQVLVESYVEITALFKSISDEPTPPYKITYDVKNDTNSETPILFLSEDHMVEYNQDYNQNNEGLPQLVQTGYSYNGWDIYCTNKGTCSQNGFPIDLLVAPQEESPKYGYMFIPEGIEGDLTLRPVSEPDPQTQNIITITLEKADHGFLTLSNNGRKIFSGDGLIKYPVDLGFPPLKIEVKPDSSYELDYINVQYNTGFEDQITDLTKSQRFEEDISLSLVFSKINFDFATSFFSQEGGAIQYSGSAGIVESKNPVLAKLSLKNENGWTLDTVLNESIESYSMFGFTRVNLPPGKFTFNVSLSSSNTTIFKVHQFTIDSTLQFAAASWQMVSLSNIDKTYQQSRDEIFYGWNDTTSLGDYWQYQELRSIKDANPLQGYWYQSFSEAPLPLKIDNDADIDPNTEIIWNLVAGKTGWNLIANPYPWSISLGVHEQTQGHGGLFEGENNISPFEDDQLAFWKWNDSLGDYTRTYSLQANEAAWVQVKENKTWQTDAYPYFTTPTSIVLEKANRSAPTLARVVNKTNWRMQLKLKNAKGKEDSYNVIGISSVPSNLEEPPSGMGNIVNLSIVEGHKKLAQNIISSNAPSWTWELALNGTENGNGELEIQGVEALRQMGYRIALHLENQSIELTDNAPISVPLKKVGSTARVSVIPAEKFTLAKTIDHLGYYKAGEMWHVQFDAGIDLDECQAVLSLHNIEGKLLSETKTQTHIGKNEVALKGTSVPGVLIVKIVIYNKNGSILFRGHQKLLQK